ncbi:variable large family protein (plasmid) [Borrelia coriaceae]|uniref:Variable large protein n=1 Tax=Borrelia coriaceae ATCC 43381 TaxID=1408429 RepID=W5SXD1_9SPIR|nr:variable large family protein [Borrelia coriaceae]AHH11560.1 Variable major outer membrane lipoprotein [Borrelia coriaceae ATCC 43381]UPA17309.1 variable large family protein [Borrelia coriaceae]
MKINIKNIRLISICATLFISLFLACNNGAIEELQKEKDYILSISNLRQGFLDIFASFGDLLKDTFGITAVTTKKGVGEQLGKIGDATNSAKTKLESIKLDESYNLIKDKAETLITKAIDILGKIVDGATKIKDATVDDSPVGGKVTDTENAEPAEEKSVKGLIEGINLILEAAKGVGTAPKGNDKKKIADSKEVAELFNLTSNVGSNTKALDGVNRAVIAASGADILASIAAVKDKKDGAGDIQNAKNAYDIAIAQKSHTNISDGEVNTNASAIAAGLALKAMAKGGKLATKATQAPGQAVNSVLIGVVDKTVNEIVSTIRRTVDKCLKDISDCIKVDSTSEVKVKSK